MMRLSVLALVVVSGLLAACGSGAGPVDDGGPLDSQAQTLPTDEVHHWYYTSTAFNSADMVGERVQFCDASNDGWGVTTPYYKTFTLDCDNGGSQLVCYDCTKFPCKKVVCPI